MGLEIEERGGRGRRRIKGEREVSGRGRCHERKAGYFEYATTRDKECSSERSKRQEEI